MADSSAPFGNCTFWKLSELKFAHTLKGVVNVVVQNVLLVPALLSLVYVLEATERSNVCKLLL